MIDRDVDKSDPTQWGLLLEELAAFPRRTIRVTAAVKQRRRTDPQNRYFHGVVVPIAKLFLNETQGGNEDGEDYGDDEAKQWLKTYLRGKPVVNRKTGEQQGVTAPRTRDMTTTEMAAFIDDAVALLRNNGYRVPAPDAFNEGKNHAELQPVDRDRPHDAGHRDAQPSQRFNRGGGGHRVQPQVQDGRR